MCFFILRYVIMTVPPDLACSTYAKSAVELLTCTSTPSLRSALMSTLQWIDTYSIFSDLVLTLVGLEALLSLVQPASHMTPESVIPHTEYMHTNPYKLSADILIGSRVWNGSKIQGWEVRAMAGQATAMRVMLRAIMTDKDYFHASETQIADIIVRYARGCEVIRREKDEVNLADAVEGSEKDIGRDVRCVEVAVDVSSLTFDFKTAAESLSAIKIAVERRCSGSVPGPVSGSRIDNNQQHTADDCQDQNKDTKSTRKNRNKVDHEDEHALALRLSAVQQWIRRSVYPIASSPFPIVTASFVVSSSFSSSSSSSSRSNSSSSSSSRSNSSSSSRSRSNSNSNSRSSSSFSSRFVSLNSTSSPTYTYTSNFTSYATNDTIC